jgi:hypothetical protein
MSLSDHIHQLTRAHLRTGPNGKAYQVPALLDELRDAVTPGQNGYGGGVSGPPIPIDPDALDLLREIEIEARRDYHEVTPFYWDGSLEALLQRFGTMDLTPEWRNYLERVSLEWIDRITAMLWPVKPRRKLVGKVCPSCGWATYGEERKVCLSIGCWDDNGNMRKIGDWDIECGSCEAGWAGDQVAWLLRALDTPEERDLTHVS